MTNAQYRAELAKLRSAQLDDADIAESFENPEYYDPTLVVEMCQQVLKSNLATVERYSVVEQLMIAAIDSGNIPIAEKALADIQKQFHSPVSFTRMAKLQGLYLEATGCVSEARKLYDDILEKDAANMVISKRLIMSFVAEQDRKEAINRLAKYLDTFMQDTEAWTLLAQLYVDEAMYAQACFCYEELMILRPTNVMFALRYADMASAIGRHEIAIKYYCFVIEWMPDRAHAWYGIRTLTQLLMNEDGKDRDRRWKDCGARPDEVADSESTRALHGLSESRLQDLYSKHSGPKMQKIVNKWIKAS